MNMTGTKPNLDTLPALLIIIGIALVIRTIQTTAPYYTECLNNPACTYKTLFTGEFKTYTTCSINALHIMWETLEAWSKPLTQG